MFPRYPEPCENREYNILSENWIGEPLRKGTCINPLAYLARAIGTKNIADIACGTNGLCAYLKEELGKDSRVVGIDKDPEVIERNRELYGKKGAEYVIGDVYDLPETGRFGVVCCLNSLHHFDDIEKAVSSMYGIMEDPGLLFIVDLLREKPWFMKCEPDEYAKARRTIDDESASHFLDIDAGKGGLIVADSILASYTAEEITEAVEGAGFREYSFDVRKDVYCTTISLCAVKDTKNTVSVEKGGDFFTVFVRKNIVFEPELQK